MKLYTVIVTCIIVLNVYFIKSLEHNHNIDSLIQARIPDLYEDRNFVTIAKNGTIDENTRKQLNLFALYKYDGGNVLNFKEFVEIYKRKPEIFKNYNEELGSGCLIFNFNEDDVCPNNRVCVEKTGKIRYSVGINPELSLLRDEKNGIKPTNSTIYDFRFKSSSSSSSSAKEMSSLNDFLALESGVEVKKDTQNYQQMSNNYTSIYLSKVDVKILDRKTKMRIKKALIINKVFDLVPLLGEILALVNIERIDLLMCKTFILKEINVLKKYLIMWDANSNYVYHTAKVLFTLLTCNGDKNKLRFMLNELMEGLCKGDLRSIRIFKEIVFTLLMDVILKTRFYYYDDIQAKLNLVRVLNKGFAFRSMVKLRFLEEMKISDELKEKLTMIIMRLDSQTTVDVELDEEVHKIPPQLGVNRLAQTFPRDFEIKKEKTQDEKIREMEMENNNSLKGVPELQDQNKERKLNPEEAKRFINEVGLGTKFRFKSAMSAKANNPNNGVQNVRDNLNNNQVIKLSEYKDKLKNEYLDKLLSETFIDMPLLEEPMPFYQKGWEKRTIYPRLRKHVNNMIRINEFLDMYPPNYSKMRLVKVDVSSLKSARFKEREKQVINQAQKEKEERKQNYMKKMNRNDSSPKDLLNIPKFKSVEERNQFANLSFDLLTKDLNSSPKEKVVEKLGDSPIHVESKTKIAVTPDHNIENHNLKNRMPPINVPSEIEHHHFANTKQEVLQKLNNNPETKKILSEVSSQSENNIRYVPEIHSIYQRDRPVQKTITINKDNPTKKLILDTLLSQQSYNDLVNQQEKENVFDPLGLYTVLKNIQTRQCSIGYICVEIGTIYGDFDLLNEKQIKVDTTEKENVHLVIQPIVVEKTIKIPIEPSHPPKIPAPEKQQEKIKIQKDELEDCDFFSGHMDSLRFKQMVDNTPKLQPAKRKFYRKVQFGEHVLATEVFKQGLNMIVLQRNHKYTKLYERTFDTNNSRNESDEMADIIRNTPCSKIIIITGIGKWMGAVTPDLLKEIKQIGGPDLYKLVTSDQDDNTMADHAFQLIARRGLCRYNGLFRVKNFDVSKALRDLLPDFTSDPNDCYFENVTLDNEKNIRSEKAFFHLIDLRLTLNVNNDNRFAFNAPTVASVSPFRGSVHGGEEIKIGGFNFGEQTYEVKEILIKGVICNDFIVLSPNLLSCITRASTILGPGMGNAIVKLKNGLSSPLRTCNVYEYMGDPAGPLTDLKRTLVKVNQMQELPIYMNTNHSDNNFSLFDHLLFNQEYHTNKLEPDHNNHSSIKIDEMVKHNYENMLSMVNQNTVLDIPKSNLRKRRFSGLIEKLQPCNDPPKN